MVSTCKDFRQVRFFQTTALVKKYFTTQFAIQVNFSKHLGIFKSILVTISNGVVNLIVAPLDNLL